jgi:hypothetical protein
MVDWIAGKVEYTEEEAAFAIGVSISQLRALVRTHVIKEEAGAEMPIPVFKPTDLLLLQMLSELHPVTSRSI